MEGQHPLLQKVAIRLFEVSPQSASVERVCKAEGVIRSEMSSRLSNVTVQIAETMRDSNSDKFEKMVDPITCTSNEEPEESLNEIDETLTEK